MLKLLGMFCILSGSTGLGIRFAKELDLRIQELSELQKLMILLKGEIRYMHQPLPEAFLQLSVSAASPLGDFFRHTAEALQRRQGRTAGEIWKENMDQDLKGLHISLQEREELTPQVEIGTRPLCRNPRCITQSQPYLPPLVRPIGGRDCCGFCDSPLE